MLLGHLYPELELLWNVHNRGTFYRNYSADVMNIDEDEVTVDLARDGILKLLPPALLTGDFELTKTNADGMRQKKDFKTRYEEMTKRLHLLEEAFVPVDTFNFRNRLATERYIEDIPVSIIDSPLSVEDILEEMNENFEGYEIADALSKFCDRTTACKAYDYLKKQHCDDEDDED